MPMITHAHPLNSHPRYYVYLLLCEDGAAGYMKIGHTMRVGERLAEIRVACPVPAKYYATMRMTGLAKAREVERALHLEFKSRNTRGDGSNLGEWFKFDFRALEDKEEFNGGCHRVFAYHYPDRKQRWWDKVYIPPLDEHRSEERKAFYASDRGKRIIRMAKQQGILTAEQKKAWAELSRPVSTI